MYLYRVEEMDGNELNEKKVRRMCNCIVLFVISSLSRALLCRGVESLRQRGKEDSVVVLYACKSVVQSYLSCHS